MIRNRLAELLSERSLKITRVAKDTGISRNTITSTAQNDSKMIQLETINTLCKYLAVTPNEFFQFIPIDLEFHVITNPIQKLRIITDEFPLTISDVDISLDLYIDCFSERNKQTFELEGVLSDVSEVDGMLIATISIKFRSEDEKIEFKKIEKMIPVGFHTSLFRTITGKIEESITNGIYDLNIESLNDSISGMMIEYESELDFVYYPLPF
ncbi:helix-turn-helix domain-containing protein [Fundicoccus ignavus]|uniref:helix-turn-helix domain-containing protein n=1 Tax=Fundicoccus ignavus TaxID=2664442 RepID=UPI00129C3E63|nr:helix-turn-helix transcriptional regulator [Fundicoccus ignavus]